jgi:phosphoserine phosphatase RsbU/P
MIRIASSDLSLLKEFCLHAGDTTPVPMAGAELTARLADADLFLLSDEEAVRVAEANSEARPTLITVADETAPLPASFKGGVVDDLLVRPLRPLDVERILRAHGQAQSLRAMEETSRAVPALLEKLQQDIQLAEKIQRRLIREKFPAIGGLSVKSKYWCGLKAGGDYFDVFEFPDGVHVGIILSDSSSYGLSTNFIGSLMQFSVHVGQDDVSDPARIVAALYGKLREEMKDKDRFNVFYGILSRKTYQLRYVECGSVFAAVKGAEGKVSWAARGENAALTKADGAVPAAKEVALEPGDRLLLASDGWSESLGQPSHALVEKFLNGPGDAQDLMNEMAFHLRKGVVKHFELDDAEEEDFPMPPQDCSVLVFDVAKNVLRLAK